MAEFFACGIKAGVNFVSPAFSSPLFDEYIAIRIHFRRIGLDNNGQSHDQVSMRQ